MLFRSQYVYQGLAAALFAAAVLNASSLDAFTAAVWEHCKASTLFRHDTWEPGLVSVVWATCVGCWYLVDFHCPAAQKYRISKVDDKSHWVVEGFGRTQEILLYIIPLALFDVVYPRRKLPDQPPSFARLAAEVFLSLFFYDLFFTIIHYASHQNQWLYQKMHAKHHSKKVQRATEAMRLTAGDQVLDVGCSISALNLVKAHPLSRSVYNAVIVYLIIELHSGYDFPWMLQNIIPFGVWGGSVRHDAHHVHGTVHFQKFFTYIDNFLDTTMEAVYPDKAEITSDTGDNTSVLARVPSTIQQQQLQY